MENEKAAVVSIDSYVFSPMRYDFDRILKRTIDDMRTRGSDTASISLKLDIVLVEQLVTDEEGKDKIILRPMFNHKIASVMQLKTKLQGQSEGEYVLVFDTENQQYVMIPLEDAQQKFF